MNEPLMKLGGSSGSHAIKQLFRRSNFSRKTQQTYFGGLADNQTKVKFKQSLVSIWQLPLILEAQIKPIFLVDRESWCRPSSIIDLFQGPKILANKTKAGKSDRKTQKRVLEGVLLVARGVGGSVDAENCKETTRKRETIFSIPNPFPRISRNQERAVRVETKLFFGRGDIRVFQPHHHELELGPMVQTPGTICNDLFLLWKDSQLAWKKTRPRKGEWIGSEQLSGTI